MEAAGEAGFYSRAGASQRYAVRDASFDPGRLGSSPGRFSRLPFRFSPGGLWPQSDFSLTPVGGAATKAIEILHSGESGSGMADSGMQKHEKLRS